jgi:hypothetical protein
VCEGFCRHEESVAAFDIYLIMRLRALLSAIRVLNCENDAPHRRTP